MNHKSRNFGDFTYAPEQVVTFENGLLGFEGDTRYVLTRTASTDPLRWLISVEESGPELAVMDPSVLVPSYTVDQLPVDSQMLTALGAESTADLKLYAVVTLPANVHHMSMNLRTPILINPSTGLGLQYPAPGIKKQPVRRAIYRDLIHSKSIDKPSMVVTLRKLNETIEIGDEITVQILEFADGGVRLGICAPKRIHISRGTHPAIPREENLRANEHMDLAVLKGIMGVYNASRDATVAVSAHNVLDLQRGLVAG